MSRVGDAGSEIEMQSPVGQVRAATWAPENSEVPEGGNSDETPPTAAERKVSQFRGRQIQMMAISLTHTMSPIGPNR